MTNSRRSRDGNPSTKAEGGPAAAFHSRVFIRQWSLLAAERLDANLLLVFVNGPTRVVWIENYRSSDIVRIHHPAQLRHVDNAPVGNFRTSGGSLLSEEQCSFTLQRRTYRLNVGLVQRNIDLRPN